MTPTCAITMVFVRTMASAGVPRGLREDFVKVCILPFQLCSCVIYLGRAAWLTVLCASLFSLAQCRPLVMENVTHILILSPSIWMVATAAKQAV